jgi:hypothetical protein
MGGFVFLMTGGFMKIGLGCGFAGIIEAKGVRSLKKGRLCVLSSSRVLSPPSYLY